MPINLEAHINPAIIAVSINQNIIRYNIWNNVRLVVEELEEGNSVIVPLGTVHGSDDGVAGEDGGARIGEDGVACNGGGGVEVTGAYERLDAVVEVEAVAHKG